MIARWWKTFLSLTLAALSLGLVAGRCSDDEVAKTSKDASAVPESEKFLENDPIGLEGTTEEPQTAKSVPQDHGGAAAPADEDALDEGTTFEEAPATTE